MILRPGDFQFPQPPEALYPQTPERPWVLEIGFGDGRFWPPFAQAFPEPPNYLGVELSGVSLLKAHRRLRAAGLTNAALTKLPAEVLVREVLPDGALDLIVVNFPDPWPKAGHEEHRLLRAPFFQTVASRLKPGGALLLTTDHEEYFGFACEQARASGAFAVEVGEAPPAALETKYALKWRELGLSPHHARLTPLPAAPRPTRVPTFAPYPENESAVPHAILKLPADFAPQSFDKVTALSPRRDGEGSWSVVLLDFYAALRREGWVALAHVTEGELVQEVLIGVTAREDGLHLVRLSRFGSPIVTPGVKAAVGALTDWLVAQGAEVRHRGY